MSVEIIKGNIFDSKEKYICHQCNCMSTAAAHLAYDMFEKYPYANIYAPRKNASQLPPIGEEPGNIIISGDGINQRYVINMLGQFYPGSPRFPNSQKDGHKIREKYFYDCLVKISKVSKLESIAFPYTIGCGAAGGNWDNYLDMITRFAAYVEKHQSTKTFIYKLESVD